MVVKACLYVADEGLLRQSHLLKVSEEVALEDCRGGKNTSRSIGDNFGDLVRQRDAIR